MLANISSKIILAFIAIFLVYAFAPIVKSIIDSIFFKRNKKSLSQRDFDEMVNRKAQQLSGGSSKSSPHLKGEKSTSISSLDKLKKSKVFTSEKDLKKYQLLQKDLQWGSGEYQSDITNLTLKGSVEADPIVITQYTKKFSNSSCLLDKFNKKKISYQDFLKYIALNIIIKDVVESNDNKTFKAYSTNISEIRSILYITCLKNKKSIENLIEKLLKDELEISLSEIQEYLYAQNLQELKQHFEQTYNILISLKQRDLEYFLEKFSYIEDDKKKVKNLYKKLVQQYHPDKWSYIKKTEYITKRLNENFHNLKSAYEKARES